MPILEPSEARLWEDGLLLDIPNYDACATAGEQYVFDEGEALKRLEFFPDILRHVKGEKGGQPFVLERWQQAIVANLFGWKDRTTGYRRYRTLLDFVGRKNGKTPFAAGLILSVLWMDGEPGAEIYGAAAEHKQATLVFEHAAGMVKQNDDLRGALQLYEGQDKSVVDHGTMSAYRVISSEHHSKHGYNALCVVVDELHALPDSELVDVLETAFGARRQPLFILITTSDFEREHSPCNEKYDYAKKVCQGIIDDPTFLPVIYEAQPEDDWKDPVTWAKANPNLGVSVTREYIEAACRKAERIPRFLNTFKRLHLNIRTGQETAWLDMDEWRACGQDDLRIEDVSGRDCIGALDLASTSDLCAFVLLFDIDGTYEVLPFFWLPQDAVHAGGKQKGFDYSPWVEQGHIKATPGKSTDYDVIREDVNALQEKYNIRELPSDAWNARQLLGQLAADGFEVLEVAQIFKYMTSGSKELERRILNRTIQHGNNPVLNWMASNVMVDMDAYDNIKPNKKKSGDKIDGITALVMAIGRMMVVEPEEKSVYTGARGMVSV